MRIQVLRLPEVVAGDDVQTPFALVVDQAGPATVGDLSQFRDDCGARAVLVTEHTVQVVDEYADADPEPDAEKPAPEPAPVRIEMGGAVDSPEETARRVGEDLRFQLGGRPSGPGPDVAAIAVDLVRQLRAAGMEPRCTRCRLTYSYPPCGDEVHRRLFPLAAEGWTDLPPTEREG